MPLEGEPIEAELLAVDADRVSLAAKDPRILPLTELVRWGNPREPRGRILVVLADGGRLVSAAAWGGGAAVRLDGKEVVVLTDRWGEVPLERSLVRGLVFAQQSHAREREQLEGAVRRTNLPPAEAGSPSDVVLMTNNDRAVGEVTEIIGGSLTLKMHAQSVKLPLSRVKAVIFNSAADGSSPSSTPSRKRNLALGLRDGSLIYADRLRASARELVISGGELALNGGSIEDVALLQSLGGRFDYLSDLESTGYRHVPYLLIEWSYHRDRNVLGEPLSVNGKRYLKGIGMHSAARLTYRLDGTYRSFESTVALDDSAGTKGSVTFGAYVLREGEWREAFLSGIVRGGDAPQPVSVDLSGAEGLTLTVDYADRGDELDHANWLDARLVKGD